MTRSRILPALLGAAGALTALVVWQLAATVGPLAGAPLPSALEALGAAGRLLGTPQIWQAMADTLVLALTGPALAQSDMKMGDMAGMKHDAAPAPAGNPRLASCIPPPMIDNVSLPPDISTVPQAQPPDQKPRNASPRLTFGSKPI